MDKKEFIARRVAKELHDGDVVNLGIGLPTLVANYIPDDVDVTMQAENGMLGVSGVAAPDEIDTDVFNAGGAYITGKPGCCYFNSATSFVIIRGGHVDATVLGAMQVDEKGNLANWMVPGRKVAGMGGAMDLVVGAQKVIVAMEHTQKGSPKIFKTCTFPLTAVGVVNLIITDMGVIRVTPEGLVLEEIAPNYKVEDVAAATAADLIVSPDLKVMEVEE